MVFRSPFMRLSRVLSALSTAGVLVGMLVVPSHAAMIAYDGFDYAAGATLADKLNGGFGWNGFWIYYDSGNWDSTRTNVAVMDGGLSYGGLASSGNCLYTSPGNIGTAYRRFASPLGGDAAIGTEVWMSFIVGDDDDTAGTDINFYHTDSAGQTNPFEYWDNVFQVKIDGRRYDGTRVLDMRGEGACNCSNGTGSGIPAGEGDYFVVIRMEIDNPTQLSFWYNPTDLVNLGPPNQTLQVNWVLSIWCMRWSAKYNRYSGRWNARFDEVRVGTTLRDVVPLEDLDNDWNYSESVFLNTTAAGADVGSQVTDFPTRLLLTGDLFDFNEFAYPDDGRDIRFATTDGVPLFYEIERWVNGSGNADTADLWVRVDTVKPGDDQQRFEMYWGNASAEDHQRPEKVFDVTNGYNAVWHFPVADTFMDATYFGNNASNNGSSDKASVVGRGRRFNNEIRCSGDETVDVPDDPTLDLTNGLTLSGWVYMDSLAYDGNSNGARAYFFGKHQNDGWNMAYCLRQQSTSELMLHTYNGTDYQNLISPSGTLVPGEWMFVAGTHDGNLTGDDTYLFFGTTSGGFTIPARADNTWTDFQNSDQKFQMARGDCSRLLNGELDEVRVSSVARDSSWLKLCFMNQRPDGDKLVEFAGGPCTDASITSASGDTAVEELELVVMSVVATGTRRQYQWYENSSPIAGATSSLYSFTAQLSDNGNQYYCEVTADCTGPSVSSSVATLTVTEKCFPPGITDTLQDQALTVGQPLTLTFTDTGSTRYYKWYKDDVWLSNDTTVKTYTVASAAVGNAGDYYGVVYNSCGRDTTAVATVSVCQPPVVTVDPQNADVVEGNAATFGIEATGTGLGYQWERDTGDVVWRTVTAATSDELFLLGQVSIDSNRYRCVVSNACGADTSAVCTLFVSPDCTPVSVGTDPNDTTVIENSEATLRITASGTNPTFQWIRGSSSIPGAITNPYTFTARRWNDEQEYRCVVTGDCGVDTSGPAVLSVTDTTRPNPTTVLTLNALGPNDINVRWTTPESDSTDVDSVFVYYSTVGYQHHTSSTKLVVAEQPADTATGEASVDLSGLDPSTRYYFSVWLRDTVGNWAAADSDTVSTIDAGVPTNPVVVRGTFVDSAHVSLNLSNFCQLVSTVDPFNLYAAYVGVWYAPGAFDLTPDTTESNLLRFPLNSIKTQAGCPGASLDTTVAVPVLSGADSVYFLSVSVVYRNDDSVMAFVQSNGDSVLMRDVTPPVNGLTVTGTYPGGRSDSAFVDLGNTGSIETKVSVVNIYCSFDSSFSDTFSIKTVSADSIAADPYRVIVRSPSFDGATQTVHCAVVQVSEQGVASPAVRTSFSVGRDLPTNPITLSAIGISSYEIALLWPGISGADSIRIWRDTVEIPVNVIDLVVPFAPRLLPGTAVTDTAGGLNASTVYHFAAQALIGGDWTAVTPASRAVGQTQAASGITNNTATIDSAWFDTTTNRIAVVWNYAFSDSMSYGVTYGYDSAATAARIPAEWGDAPAAADTAWVQLGEDIVFDTACYVFIRLRRTGSDASPATEQATAVVRIPHYTWQPIRYFTAATNDTVRAFNNDVALWYDGNWGFGAFTDTVRAYVPSALPSGFAAVSAGMTLTTYEDGPSLSLALRYDSVPSGYRPEDVRMYALTGSGQWEVFHDYTLHTARGMVSVDERLVSLVGMPLILMVDLQAPSVQVQSDLDLAVAPNSILQDTIQVSDNVGNMIVTLLYSRAENAARPMLYDTLAGTNGTITTEIPGGYVTDDGGVRAYLVVSDGLHHDTVNISRQVIRAQASDISTEPDRWVPLRTTAVLDEPGMGRIISEAVGDAYDNTRMRVFRWFDPTATEDLSTGSHDWVEYSEAASAVFGLKPGKLMWVKTDVSRNMDFGAGVTVSLRRDQELSLAPNNWTDLALPYSFGIYLGDILDATGAGGDSLQVYRWSRGQDGTYTTELMYLSLLPDSMYRDKSQLLSSGTREGYSIYNPRAQQVTLRVPPVTHAMSSYLVNQRIAKGRGLSAESWALKVVAENISGERLGSAVLGYEPLDDAGVSWFPQAPSFGTLRVGVYDRTSKTVYGHAVGHAMPGGAVTYEVVFTNSGDKAMNVACRIEGLERLSDSLQAALVDPLTGVVQDIDGVLRVNVPAKGRAMRSVSVGHPSYFAGVMAGVKPFAQFVAYPNPFRGAVTVRFMLPADVSRVEYRLFDALGRLVWHYTERSGIRVGLNQVVWDGTNTLRKAAATGTYLLRATAFHTDGRELATKETRLVNVK